MKNVERISFNQAVHFPSPLGDLIGLPVFELDSNEPVRLGDFSKPRSKATDSPLQALRDAAAIARGNHKTGDLLVCRHPRTNRWQVWERRRVCGRVSTSGGDSRAKRTGQGTGAIFIG